jgi:hypothetical protein
MPYVKQEQRPDLDKIVELMKETKLILIDDLSHLLFEFCKRHIEPSYNNFKNFRAELYEVTEEIKRKLIVPSKIVGTRYHAPHPDFLGHLEAVINLMIEQDIKANGDLNYILFAYGKRYVSACRSNLIKEILVARDKVGELLLAPYEDEKIKENGDV